MAELDDRAETALPLVFDDPAPKDSASARDLRVTDAAGGDGHRDLVRAVAGDLVKLVSAQHGKRVIANSSDKLASQLAHCLWSVIVLSKMQNVDLENSFMEAMDRLENHLLEAPE